MNAAVRHPHIRQEVDLAFRVSGQSVEIFEVRQAYGGAPGEKIELPVAKATFIRPARRWRVFWLRQDMKWHSYKPVPDVATIEEFVLPWSGAPVAFRSLILHG